MAAPHRSVLGGVSRSHLSSPRLSPLETHTTLSPKHFYETIRLSKEENVWRCMHSAAYAEPVLGARRMRMQVSTATGLSSLTQRANQMLESLQRPEDTFLAKSASAGLFSPTYNKLPSEIDFKRAIEKLGRVYAQGGVDALKLSLQEGKTHEVTLEAEEKMYARISLQGQLCPLVVTINRSRGRLVAYVSKTVQEPMEMICDAKVTGDRIWISDPGIRFRPNTLYICFAAVEECVFSLNVQFGQKKRAVTKEKWKPEVVASTDNEWEQVFGTFTEHKPKFSKNFIAKNRVLQRVDSPEIISYHLEKIMTVDIRRREAVKRWHDQLKLKKKRALDLLNRQQLKEIERQKQMEIAKEKAAVANTQEKWLAIVWSLKSVDCLMEKFAIRKAQIAIEGKKMTAARKLQGAYRKHMHFSNGKQLSLLRGALSLKLAVRHLTNIDGPGHTSSLFRLICHSAKLASVPIQFSEFHKRIAFVQSIWRSVLQRHKQAFEQLIALWNSCMATAISSASKKKPVVVRGKKVKENPTLRYLNITSATRNQILGGHFEAARNWLMQECKLYVESMKSGARDRAAPDFRCVPSSEDMMKMIEKAADSTQQQPTD